jgi:hypothetical protein
VIFSLYPKKNCTFIENKGNGGRGRDSLFRYFRKTGVGRHWKKDRARDRELTINANFTTVKNNTIE